MEPGEAAPLPSQVQSGQQPRGHLLLAFWGHRLRKAGREACGLLPRMLPVSRGKDVTRLSNSHLLRQTLKAKTGGQSPFPWELFSHRTRGERRGTRPPPACPYPFLPSTQRTTVMSHEAEH